MEAQSGTSILAARSDLPPRARQVLAQQLAETDTLLEPLLHGALDDLEQELFRIAEQSSGGQTQHEALEALREVKRTRAEFQPHVTSLLERQFADFGRSRMAEPHHQAKPRDGGLALVDPHEFDESMALEDLSSRAELHAGNALFDLCHRYAVLIAAPPLDNEALPPGPHALADVLSDASRMLGLERPHRLLFYRLCDRRFYGAAEAFYARLNDHMEAIGILPHLQSYLPRRARSTSHAQPDEPATQTALPPQTDFSPPPLARSAPVPAPPASDMGELHTLLEARRHAREPDAPPAIAATEQSFASMPQLQEALAALQALPSRSGGPLGGQKLEGDLLTQLRQASGNGQAPQLQAEHRDALDLMSLLFDRLITETRTEGAAQQLLGNLQVPLLRIALADSGFFTVRDHPARRLLNTVLEIANLWLDRTDGNFDTALNQRLQRSVHRVASEFKDDAGIVEREADDLESHLRLLKRRSEIAERRQVEAAQGRDRLHQARATAAAAITKRTAATKTTPLVRALLEHAWTDALTLTLLREGENSDEYRRRLAAADQLLGSATARDDTRLAADLNHGLTQVGLQAAEADQITRYVLELPQQPASQGLPPPSQTELLIRLKSRQKADAGDTDAPATGARRMLPLTPTERKSLATLIKLPFGSWLEFTINQQGQKVARKLAWYTPISGRCLLINARGAAAPERMLDQVARLMARGQVCLLPPQDNGMIDRAWSALVAGLRKFGRTH
jgi:Protein of unknown function (DUF1631)